VRWDTPPYERGEARPSPPHSIPTKEGGRRDAPPHERGGPRPKAPVPPCVAPLCVFASGPATWMPLGHVTRRPRWRRIVKKAHKLERVTCLCHVLGELDLHKPAPARRWHHAPSAIPLSSHALPSPVIAACPVSPQVCDIAGPHRHASGLAADSSRRVRAAVHAAVGLSELSERGAATRLLGYSATRVLGYSGTWLLGYLGTWVLGYVA
jgi:hypothetical protein